MISRMRSAFAKAAVRRRHAAEYKQLMRLDDTILRDIGLTRDDARAAAWTTRRSGFFI